MPGALGGSGKGGDDVCYLLGGANDVQRGRKTSGGANWGGQMEEGKREGNRLHEVKKGARGIGSARWCSNKSLRKKKGGGSGMGCALRRWWKKERRSLAEICLTR